MSIFDAEPDLYGLRRSGRQRKDVDRYEISPTEPVKKVRGRGRGGKRRNVSGGGWGALQSSSEEEQDSSDESSDYGSQVYSRGFGRGRGRQRYQRRPAQRQPTRRRIAIDSDDSSSSSDDSSDYSSSSAVHRATFSRRAAAQTAVSYKEQSDAQTDSDDVVEWVDEKKAAEEEDVIAIERIMDSRIGRKGAVGSTTAVYNCEEVGDPNANFDPETDEKEVQYLVKWKMWAHIHNTWESSAGLRDQKVNGLKKLDNYIKQQAEIREWKKAASVEDIEGFELQLEMNRLISEQYTTVYRIISHKYPRSATHDKPDYLCKWQGLPYADSTWEDGELIFKRFPSEVEAHNQRQKSQKIPSKYHRVLASRPKFQSFKSQPPYMGSYSDLLLRDYQLDGVNWLLLSWTREKSVILADEMGLGKTIQTICFLSALFHEYQLYGPFLIVVPLSTIVTWQREFASWAAELNVILYVGDVSSRNKIREYEWWHHNSRRLKFNALITTYEILLKDKSFLGSFSWAVLAVDEAHRLKNDDSLLYKTLIQFDTNHRILITGTPLQNSLRELWALLHFLMPLRFEDWEDFETRHSTADRQGITALHKELESFLLRRVKRDVEKSLPSKTEQILRVEMTSLQRQYYKWLLTRNYEMLRRDSRSNISGFINIIVELKKCCNHSYLIRSPEAVPKQSNDELLMALVKGSGKLMLLNKLLPRLRADGHRVLIFSQMVRMLDLLADYMQLNRFPFQRLDGQVSSEARKQAIDHFNAEGSQDFCFLLSTRAGGLGVNLHTADTVIIFDSDWNPQNDLQAQARAHRIGQKNQVSVYRLVTKGSVEEDIVERAKRKMVLDHLVIQRMDTSGRTILNTRASSTQGAANNPFSKDELSAILKFGAEELFEAADEAEPQVDIDEILKRAEIREVSSDTSAAAEELLSQFKVVNFDNLENEEIEPPSTAEKDWDDIIPKEYLAKMQLEEEENRLREMNLGPRERKLHRPFDLESYYSEEERRRRKQIGRTESESSFEADESDMDDDTSKGRRVKQKRTKGSFGFTKAEIRRFIRSFKRFADPLNRLDAIAIDAELQEKSESDLKAFAEHVQHTAQQQMDEWNRNKQTMEADEKPENNQAENTVLEVKDEMKNGVEKKDQKKIVRGPSVVIGGVSVYIPTIIKTQQDLLPLVQCIPADKNARNSFEITMPVRLPQNWDCTGWSKIDDQNLLLGVYEYGLGSWDSIKMDPRLDLGDKILLDDNKKPQATHLAKRLDYLLKLLKKQAIQNEAQSVSGKRKKKKEKKAKSAEIIANDNNDADDPITKTEKHKEKRKKHKHHEKSAEFIEDDMDVGDEAQPVHETEKKSHKHEKKHKKKHKHKKSHDPANEPMHFTTHETVTVAEDSQSQEFGLSTEVFKKAKELLRPVKRDIRYIDHPDKNLPEAEQIQHTRNCLLSIGDHINRTLKQEFHDLGEVKEWREHLWVFVSQFTELDANRLHKLYKHAAKKRDETTPSKEPASHKLGQSHDPQKDSSHDGRDGKKHKRDKEKHRHHHRDSHHRHGHYHRHHGDGADNPEKDQSSERKRRLSQDDENSHRHHHHRRYEDGPESRGRFDDQHSSRSRDYHHEPAFSRHSFDRPNTHDDRRPEHSRPSDSWRAQIGNFSSARDRADSFSRDNPEDQSRDGADAPYAPDSHNRSPRGAEVYLPPSEYPRNDRRFQRDYSHQSHYPYSQYGPPMPSYASRFDQRPPLLPPPPHVLSAGYPTPPHDRPSHHQAHHQAPSWSSIPFSASAVLPSLAHHGHSATAPSDQQPDASSQYPPTPQSSWPSSSTSSTAPNSSLSPPSTSMPHKSPGSQISPPVIDPRKRPRLHTADTNTPEKFARVDEH